MPIPFSKKSQRNLIKASENGAKTSAKRVGLKPSADWHKRNFLTSVLIPSLFLVGFFFSQLGVLIGVRAEQFDDVAFAQTFILTPLIFLGGVFYSASLLPQPWETLTRFDPIFYMINLVRYGFVGFSEVSIPLSLLALTGATAALFLVNLRLFSRGYRLRA